MFTIMHTLLYPGVLGSLMYAVPDNIASGRMPFEFVQVATVCALFSMFVMDYAHSVTEDNKNDYSYGTFIADLLIVVLLFVAGQRLLGAKIPPDIHPAWFLVGVKIAALCWELLKHGGSHQTPAKRAERGTDFAFLLLYVLVGVVAQGAERSFTSILMILVLFGDAFYYVLYRKIVTRKETRGVA